MDITKLKEEIAKMPEQGYKNNMFIGKKPVPKTPIIKELAKKWGIPVKEYKLPEIKDFGEVVGLPEIKEDAPTTKFDAQAFFSETEKKEPMLFLDEISINGITGETFTNGENN